MWSMVVTTSVAGTQPPWCERRVLEGRNDPAAGFAAAAGWGAFSSRSPAGPDGNSEYEAVTSRA